jgi:hypothetical protein
LKIVKQTTEASSSRRETTFWSSFASSILVTNFLPSAVFAANDLGLAFVLPILFPILLAAISAIWFIILALALKKSIYSGAMVVVSTLIFGLCIYAAMVIPDHYAREAAREELRNAASTTFDKTSIAHTNVELINLGYEHARELAKGSNFRVFNKELITERAKGAICYEKNQFASMIEFLGRGIIDNCLVVSKIVGPNIPHTAIVLRSGEARDLGLKLNQTYYVSASERIDGVERGLVRTVGGYPRELFIQEKCSGYYELCIVRAVAGVFAIRDEPQKIRGGEEARRLIDMTSRRLMQNEKNDNHHTISKIYSAAVEAQFHYFDETLGQNSNERSTLEQEVIGLINKSRSADKNVNGHEADWAKHLRPNTAYLSDLARRLLKEKREGRDLDKWTILLAHQSEPFPPDVRALAKDWLSEIANYHGSVLT